MSRRLERWLIAGVLIFALLVRLSGIAFGLPFHVLSTDEDTNVNAALELIKLHTLLPVLHQQIFQQILYEPPLLSYIYALLFTPVAFAVHDIWSPQTLSILYMIARATNALISTASVYLVYKIGKRIFHRAEPALFAAAFLATSFIDVTVASTARHWTLGTFWCVLGLYLLLRAFDSSRSTRWLLLAAGTAFGLAFGASYLVYYLPLAAMYLIRRARHAHPEQPWRRIISNREVWEEAGTVFVPFLLLAGVFYAVYPYAFMDQVWSHIVAHGVRSFPAFWIFYSQTLWNLEPPLFLFGIVGLGYGIRRSYAVVPVAFGIGLMMYVFLPNISRYLLPFLPLFALLAGYGLAECLHAISSRLCSRIILGALVGYAALVYGRYEVLIARNDTEASFWIWARAHVPVGSELILAAPDMDPAAMVRPGIRVVSLDGENATAPRDKQDTLKRALAAPSAGQYLVGASWTPGRALPTHDASYLSAVVASSTQIMTRFAAGADENEKLFIGGAYNGSGTSLVELLYGTQMLGPDITVWRLGDEP